MKNITAFIATACFLLGCGASQPPPTQKLADVQAATRSATELGATTEPRAQLHLKLAEEQMGNAKAAMKDDENETANRLLDRAKSDAELAVALMREHQAKQTFTKASDKADSQRSVNAAQGATP